MISHAGDVAGVTPDDLVRTLDLLDQQCRRILDLSRSVSGGQRTLQYSTAALLWRSPARLEFESRLTDLQRLLARSSAALAAALAECDRARDLVRSELGAAVSRAAEEKTFIGYPARATGR